MSADATPPVTSWLTKTRASRKRRALLSPTVSTWLTASNLNGQKTSEFSKNSEVFLLYAAPQ
jgi:hypothetical protein